MGKITDIKDIRQMQANHMQNGNLKTEAARIIASNTTVQEMVEEALLRGSSLSLAKKIADFYGDRYGVYLDYYQYPTPPMEPLADWERELLESSTPPVNPPFDPNEDLKKWDFPFLVVAIGEKGQRYSLARFVYAEDAQEFAKRKMLDPDDNWADYTIGVKYDVPKN